jgi:hypothetical protein
MEDDGWRTTTGWVGMRARVRQYDAKQGNPESWDIQVP